VCVILVLRLPRWRNWQAHGAERFKGAARFVPEVSSTKIADGHFKGRLGLRTGMPLEARDPHE
jgi:hypothetical protein